MNTATIVWAVLIGTAYVSWPILGKWSGAPAAWVSAIVIFASMLATIGTSFSKLLSGPAFNTRALAVLFLAGFLNGIAVYVYSIKAADPAVPTSAFLTTVFVVMIVLSPILDWGLNGAALSVRQFFGIALACGAVYLLKG